MNLKPEFTFDYAAAPESLRPTIKPKYGLFINNEFVAPQSRKYFPSLNPMTEKVLTRISEANKEDVALAVKAARKALPVWASLPGSERAKYIFRVARLLQERTREFAVAEALDGGKIIREARDDDLPLSVQSFFYHAGWADKLEFAFSDIINPEPLGVIGAIVPWNFPTLMLAWKLAPALACGNTIVLKPAETTSLTALMFAELLSDANFPAGVVNIVTGAGSTGAALVDHPSVDKIAFTGSTEVGKIIGAQARAQGKSVTLELGGKSAHIIMEDAPLDQVVEKIVDGIFFNRGHTCCAGTRLLVQENIHDDLIRRLDRRIQTLRIGDPLDKNTDIGPINSLEQLKIIQEMVKSGENDGAIKYETKCELPKEGYWFRPTIFTNVSPSMRISREEIFGPVLAVMTFRTPDEAVELANNSEYGLAAGVWTSKQSKVYEISGKLKVGVVWANTYNKFDASSPFGGYKESGYGREGGIHGLRHYLKEGKK